MQTVKTLMCIPIPYMLINSLMVSDSVRFWGRAGQSMEDTDENDKLNARSVPSRAGMNCAKCQSRDRLLITKCDCA